MTARSARPRRSQEERTAATRGAVLAAGRRLFARDGFNAVSIEALLAEAHVTRGALYHHFDSKAAVFAAVFDAVEADLARRLAQAGAERPDAWGRLQAGAQAFLAACLDREVQRIVLLDAPAVLGPAEVRRVEELYTMRLLRAGLAAAADEGEIPQVQVEMLAEFLLGGLSQCAVTIAGAHDAADAERRAWVAVEAVLEGLRLR